MMAHLTIADLSSRMSSMADKPKKKTGWMKKSSPRERKPKKEPPAAKADKAVLYDHPRSKKD